MNHQNLLFFLCLVLSFLYVQTQTCTIDNTDFSSSNPLSPPSGTYTLSPESEIIQGVNYGRLISVASRIWLLTPFTLKASSTQFTNPCPIGWTLPTSQDLINLVKVTGSNPLEILRNSSLFNMNTSLYYLSSTKAYPTYTNASLSQTWAFYGIKFLTTGLPQVTAINSYFSSKLLQAFCVFKRANETNNVSGVSGLNVKGIDKKDLLKGFKYILSVNNTNVVDYSWKIGTVQGNSKYLDVIPMKEGSFFLNYKVKMFDGSVVGDCKTIWVRNYTGSEATTDFSLSNVNVVNYPFFDHRTRGLHFNSGASPLAPKDEGGAYIMYSEKDTMFLHVKTIDNEGTQISDRNLSIKGLPFDIISVGYGWIALICDYLNPHKLFLLGMDTKTNVTVFQRNIMNSNDSPLNYTSDQLIFFKDVKGTPLFGMNAMFNPTNGKLSLGKERLAVIFAHYNFFGQNTDGTRSDHTGDTLFTVNLKGEDEKIAFSWGSSHSLTQNILYNGEKFMTAALGDAYPLNIMFSIEDGLNSNDKPDPFTGRYNILDFLKSSTLLPDILTGNGIGFSNGRLGSIIQLADSKTFVLSYARRRSWTVFEGKNVSSEINQLGLLFYDENLNLLKDVYLGEGQWVNQVKSCRYGRNIFITYIISNKRTVLSGTFLDPNANNDDIQYMMLVNENGDILSGPLLYNSFSTILPPSDEIRMMADGRCAWTFIDKEYILNYVHLTPPAQTPSSYNDVANSQFFNQGDFYLINSYDLKQYRMGVVESRSQTYINIVDLGLTKFSLISSVMKSRHGNGKLKA